MNDTRLSQLAWAGALIIGGAILLLFNFDLLTAFEPLAQYILAGALALGGVGFFVGFVAARENWWRLIPGWTLLALAMMVALSVFPAVNRALIPSILFLGLAIAFGHIYLLQRGVNWWAIIPGGFFLVLGVVVALSAYLTSLTLLGSLLFIGIGLVFFALYLLGDRSRQWWALIPASILALFGVFIVSAGGEEPSGLLRWWPLAAIGVGVIMVWRTMRRQPTEKLVMNRAPSMKSAAPPASETTVTGRGVLGEYTQPAPGASVQVLPDPEETN
jgi:hypothetical protein